MDAPTVTFKTRQNNTCYVRFTKNGVAPVGNTLRLGMPAITLETDADTGIDATILQTTGKVSLVLTEENAEMLDMILPEELLDTKVEVSLEKDGTEKTIFVGYVVLQEYSQPYDSYPYQMDINLKGMLSILEDVQVAAKDEDGEYAAAHNFAYYIVEAMEAVDFTPTKVITNVPNDEIWLQARIQREWFLEETSEEINDVRTPSVEGCTWYDAFDRLLLADALTMWQDGDVLYIQSKGPYNYYREYDWGDFREIAGGASDPNDPYPLPTVGSFADALTNMSNDNKQNFLMPYGNVYTSQSLQETDLFSWKTDWLADWWYERMTDEDWISYIFRTTTSQRGVTLTRRIYYETGFVDDEGHGGISQYEDVPPETSLCIFGNLTTNYQVGGAIGFIQKIHAYYREDPSEYDGYEQDDPISMDDPSPKLYLLGATTGWGNRDVPAITIDCPVRLGDNKGAICVNFSLRSVATNDAGYPTAIRDELQGNFLINVSVTCYNIATNTGVWSVVFRPLFDDNGKLLTNCQNNEKEYADADLQEAIIPNRTCMTWDGCEGYIIPLTDKPFDNDGLMAIRVTVYAPYRLETGISNPYIYECSDLKVSYHRQVIEGTGDDLTYIPDNTDILRKQVQTHAIGYTIKGEDVTVDLDTWNDTNDTTTKNSRTLQPAVYSKTNWNRAATEWGYYRKVIEYDDAIQNADPLALVTGYDGNTYRQVGCGSWDSETEGGRKTYVQITSEGLSQLSGFTENAQST